MLVYYENKTNKRKDTINRKIENKEQITPYYI